MASAAMRNFGGCCLMLNEVDNTDDNDDDDDADDGNLRGASMEATARVQDKNRIQSKI
jgi:hypothetical protein